MGIVKIIAPENKDREREEKNISWKQQADFEADRGKGMVSSTLLLVYLLLAVLISLFKLVFFLTLFLCHRLNFLFLSSLIFVKSRFEVQMHLELCKWITEASYCALSLQKAVFAY